MSPIRPENLPLYPDNWDDIRAAILERSGNKCEGSPAYPDCRVDNYSQHPATSSRVVLTIAHLDHDPTNSDNDNLRAWCQRCHNTYDAPHRAKNRKRRKREAEVLEEFLPPVPMTTTSGALLNEIAGKMARRIILLEKEIGELRIVREDWKAAVKEQLDLTARGISKACIAQALPDILVKASSKLAAHNESLKLTVKQDAKTILKQARALRTAVALLEVANENAGDVRLAAFLKEFGK